LNSVGSAEQSWKHGNNPQLTVTTGRSPPTCYCTRRRRTHTGLCQNHFNDKHFDTPTMAILPHIQGTGGHGLETTRTAGNPATGAVEGVVVSREVARVLEAGRSCYSLCLPLFSFFLFSFPPKFTRSILLRRPSHVSAASALLQRLACGMSLGLLYFVASRVPLTNGNEAPLHVMSCRLRHEHATARMSVTSCESHAFPCPLLTCFFFVLLFFFSRCARALAGHGQYWRRLESALSPCGSEGA